MRFQEMDHQVTWGEQLAAPDDGPVTVVNVFTMAPDDVETFLAVWADDAAYMKSRPGFIRTQPHRGTAGSASFVNVATWESAGDLRAAFSAPEFAQATARYPDSVVATPHATTPVAVPGICTA